MRRTTALLLVAATLALAACGDGDDSVASGGSTTSTRPTTSTTEGTTTTTAPGPSDEGSTGGSGGGSGPTGQPAPSGRATIRITVGGGFVPAGYDFTTVPTVVQPDGTSFAPGAMTMQYPGPAVTPVMTGRLSAATLEGLVQRAKAAHLDQAGREFGQPGVTDMPSTTITVVIDGKAHTTSVYALGFDDPAASGVTPAQRQARTEVQGFVTAVGDAVGAAATTTYQPTAYQVLSLPTEPASAATEEPKPNELDWPIAGRPLGENTCLDLAGADATALAKALPKATSITVWRNGGGHWHVFVRAALPGDEPCASRR